MGKMRTAFTINPPIPFNDVIEEEVGFTVDRPPPSSRLTVVGITVHVQPHRADGDSRREDRETNLAAGNLAVNENAQVYRAFS